MWQLFTEGHGKRTRKTGSVDSKPEGTSCSGIWFTALLSNVARIGLKVNLQETFSAGKNKNKSNEKWTPSDISTCAWATSLNGHANIDDDVIAQAEFMRLKEEQQKHLQQELRYFFDDFYSDLVFLTLQCSCKAAKYKRIVIRSLGISPYLSSEKLQKSKTFGYFWSGWGDHEIRQSFGSKKRLQLIENLQIARTCPYRVWIEREP